MWNKVTRAKSPVDAASQSYRWRSCYDFSQNQRCQGHAQLLHHQLRRRSTLRCVHHSKQHGLFSPSAAKNPRPLFTSRQNKSRT